MSPLNSSALGWKLCCKLTPSLRHLKKTRLVFRRCGGLGQSKGTERISGRKSKGGGTTRKDSVQTTGKPITVVSLRTAAFRGPGSSLCGFLHHLKRSEEEFYLVKHMLSAKEFN